MDIQELLMPLLDDQQDMFNRELADPTAIIKHDELSARHLWISDVDINTVDDVSRWILRYNKEDFGKEPKDRKPVKLFIYSYGGDLDVTFQLLSMIQCSKTPIYGYCLGQACSAAFFILVGCHKRFALPMSTLMAHQGSAGMEGTYNVVTAQNDYYKRQIKNIGDIIVERTNIPRATYNKKIKTEWYMTTEEALKLGVIDEVIKDLDEVVS